MRFGWRGRAAKKPRDFVARASFGRGERVRTSDLVVPNDARYRAALHPECGPGKSRNLDFYSAKLDPRLQLHGRSEYDLLSTRHSASHRLPNLYPEHRTNTIHPSTFQDETQDCQLPTNNCQLITNN